ncbi:NUDIX domain-containing protein [Sphaerisporangium sp. NPDC049002]|uniref:NUDIX domain-containing protein n=1 Tax=Sphaerisporangium sp. NPDC049002 TaxID=3155392 RepID=UPI0033FC16A2
MTDTWWQYVERVAAGATQVSIAGAAGVKPSTVWRWKAGATPSTEVAIRLARAYGRPIAEALAAAGVITPGEAGVTEVVVTMSPSELDDDDLIREVRRRMTRYRSHAEEYDHVPEEATKPERPPVVAAIVTCERGVLVGRRNDGKPPWTFIAGEVEPGESMADAAIREVKEETGLRVVAAEREIARRVHPKTGRTMIYLACSPTGNTEVFVGDKDELAEVRWASLADAEELLPGLFEPVHRYLLEQLGS